MKKFHNIFDIDLLTSIRWIWCVYTLHYNCNSRYMPMSLKATLLAYLNACLIDYSTCEALFNQFFCCFVHGIGKITNYNNFVVSNHFFMIFWIIFCLAPFSDVFLLSSTLSVSDEWILKSWPCRLNAKM